MCKGAWMDGVVNAQERRNLEAVRINLGIGEEEAETIEKSAAPPAYIEYHSKVEDFFVDGEITVNERKYLDQLQERLDLDKNTAETIEETIRNFISSND